MYATRRVFIAAAMFSCLHVAVLAAGDFQRTTHAGPQTAGLFAGQDLNRPDASGQTPLQQAATLGKADTLQAMLAAGADPLARDLHGRMALHAAAASGDVAGLRVLLARTPVGVVDRTGETPLHAAARGARADAVRLLLAVGADANARNQEGQTPLHVLGAAARPDVPEVETLLEQLAAELIAAGAQPDLRDNQGTPAWPRSAPAPGDFRQPSGYPTYDEIAATLLNYQTQYPALCQRFDLGPSSTTKRLYALKVSDNVAVQEDEPEFKWISTLHGDETTGVVMCLNMINYLMTNYPSDTRVQNLVNNVEIWFLPCANPHGYANNTRSNANGYDLNRSFPEGSGSNPDPNSTAGRQPEVATIMNWGFANSFTLGVNYHGGALVVNYPFDNDNLGSVFSPSPDEDLFVWISEEYSRYNSPMWNSTSFTHGITNGAAWYSIDGGLQDYDYRYQGCNHVTIEVSNTKNPAYTQMPTFWSQNQNSMLAFMETILTGARGVVTDAATGAPVYATVTVVGRNHRVYTDPDVGDYHRMLRPGTYQLKFEATGYETVTLPVTVGTGAATRLDVGMGGPPVLITPNGGETLTAGTPATIAWTGAASAQFHVQQSSNFGETGVATDSFESGTLSSAFTLGGNANWYVTTGTGTYHTGIYGVRAGAITHNQTTWMTRTAEGGPISFWYKTSSEPGYDVFRFYVDGVEKLARSGLGNWTFYTTSLPAGTHTLKWEYTKDAGVSGGNDTVYIDDLSLIGDATAWSDVIALTPVGAMSTEWTPTVTGSANKVRVRTRFATGNYSSWDESAATFTVLPAATGACCAVDGTCGVLTAAECLSAGGTYQGDDVVCDPNPCPQPTGACCTGGACAELTATECTATGGVYQGDGVPCDPNPCNSLCVGDANCDRTVSWRDIDFFIAGLNDNVAGWEALFPPPGPTCLFAGLDNDLDGHVTWRDIDPFIARLNTICP